MVDGARVLCRVTSVRSRSWRLASYLLAPQIRDKPRADGGDLRAYHRRLEEQAPNEVAEWRQMLVDWTEDHTRPCPYVSALPSTYLFC